MPSINFHYVQLLVPESKQNDLRNEIRLKNFDLLKKTGFISRDKYMPTNGMSFRLVHPKTIKAKKFDPEAKDFSDELWERHWATDAVFDFGNEMASVIGSRAGVKVLKEYFESEFDVPVELWSVDVDVVACLEALQQAYKDLEIKKINVTEFVTPEKLVTKGNFKLLKNSDGSRFIEKWKNEIASITVAIKDGPDVKIKAVINNKGTMSISDTASEGMIDEIKQIIFDNVIVSVEQAEEEETPVLPPSAPIDAAIPMEV